MWWGMQVMHKAPILESKQIEHVLNERRILEEASSHPFCVGLVRAYQDKPCLYLLQEWVGGQPCPLLLPHDSHVIQVACMN